MGVRIVIVGGGSYHWVPRLLADFAHTPSLQDAEVVLHDIDPRRPRQIAAYGAEVARRCAVPLTVGVEDDRRAALEDADHVVTAFSVGGFDSMRFDLEIPLRYGVVQPIGDSVGPGGIMRALRSVPVLLEMARDIEEVCPDAWLVNVTNPLTALCRAVTRETPVKTVGLCNELVGFQFVMSLLFDCGMHEVDPVVAGVNHLPLVTELRIGDRDGFVALRELLDDPGAGRAPLWMDPPPQTNWQKVSPGEAWTKADLLHNHRLKLEIFRRFGVLPGSADHHVAEFFPWFVHPDSHDGRTWGVHVYGLQGHMADADTDRAEFEAALAADEVVPLPSGELVAPLLDGLVGGEPRSLPVNVPNRGQVANLPEGPVVEVMATVDGDGVRSRDVAAAPGIVGEHLRRVSFGQERTVEAALRGDAGLVLEAMLADPLTCRLPYERVVAMTDEMLAATSPWLPQFG